MKSKETSQDERDHEINNFENENPDVLMLNEIEKR
jgi:hypothetical protein